jgi:hypothetical protein
MYYFVEYMISSKSILKFEATELDGETIYDNYEYFLMDIKK